MSLNEKSKEIYLGNVKKGFYEDNEDLKNVIHNHAPHLMPALLKLIFAQRVALIHSELSEALESNRKDKKVNPLVYAADWDSMNDEQFKESFEMEIKDTEEDEIADTEIRILDLNGSEKMDLDFHVKQKLRYNSLRPHKHGKKY